MNMMRIVWRPSSSRGSGSPSRPRKPPEPTLDGSRGCHKSTGYEDKHILGVVPNYATVNDPAKIYIPLASGEKFIDRRAR